MRTILIAALIMLAGAAPAAAQIGIPPPPPPPPPLAAPPPGDIAPEALERIYRGDDGSAYYQRVVGTKIVGFGEHPGQGYAFVISGERSEDGKTLSGTFWDVAKGSRAARGTITFAASQGGERLTVTGGGPLGASTYDAIAADGLPWPGPREAGFQAISATDLDGAFLGDDGSHAYARDVDGAVVWVAEAPNVDGERPHWASVFVGTRAGGGISGEWWDVPKGTRSLHGPFAAASEVNLRRTTVKQQISGTAHTKLTTLVPDYKVDLDEMAAALNQAFKGNVMGFGWAIAKDGKVVREGGDGFRRFRAAKPKIELPFSSTTENDGGSTGKTVTAAALVRALELRGKTVDDSVAPYLPKAWKKGPGVQNLTFRQLMDHTAQLFYAGKKTCSDDPFDCLRQAFEQGRTRPHETPGPGAEYHNIHYTALRVVLPFLVEKAKMTALFKTAAPKPGRLTRKRLNRGFSRVFRDYTVSVLKQAGVSAGFTYRTNNFAHWYDFPTSAPKPEPPADSYLKAGSGSLRSSAREYTEFLAALEGGKIVSPRAYAQMRSGYMGFDIKGSAGILNGGLGEVWRKDGACGGCGSQLVVLPDHVQAYVTWNSSRNSYTPGAESILRNAYENALVS